MKTLFKGRGLKFDLDGGFTHEKPINCERWGRIDIPGIVGYFFVMVRVEYHRWFMHWVKRFCVYWEV